MKVLYRILMVAGVLIIALMLYLTYLQQADQLKIQKEQHILGVYSAYKNNIDACTAAAKQANKDDQFIKTNCTDQINSSLVGQYLKEWGYSNLLQQ